jgi:hypothetical protein
MGQSKSYTPKEACAVLMASVEVYRQKTQALAQLHSAMLVCYKRHLRQLVADGLLDSQELDAILACERTGEALWTKQQEFRRDWTNMLLPIWEQLA